MEYTGDLPKNQTERLSRVAVRPQVTIDDLELAEIWQHLLLKVRNVIDTILKVNILGRFTPERKTVLDALREALRQRAYVPILFDFDPL